MVHWQILTSVLFIIVICLILFYTAKRNKSFNEKYWIEDKSKARYLKSMDFTSTPQCAAKWTTCPSNGGFMCCPYSNGTCCGSSLTCCSEGYKCSDDGTSCISQ